MNDAGARCANCGAAVSGRYCGACGQRLEAPVHSLWHFAQVAAEDLTHADSRVWRTFGALLARPGYLTREFLAGRRVRYLPPVRLYLVLSVAFFLWASGTHSAGDVVRFDDDTAAPAAVPGAADTPPGAERPCTGFDYQGPWRAELAPKARRACERIALDNGRSLQAALLHNLPRAMFVFLPLLAGAMKLLYWRPHRYYVEHLLLLLHNHAFVFLAVPLAWVVGVLVPPVASVVRGAVWLYMAWYMYRSMRTVYGQGRWLTVSKLLVMSFFYLVCAAVMVALTTVLSALTLG